jgi:hypothetical protein
MSDEFYFQAEEEVRKLLEAQRKKIPQTLEKPRFFLRQTIRGMAVPKLQGSR